MEQEACTGARGLSLDSAAHVLSKKLRGDLQMDVLHKKMELRVTSPRFTEQYEGCFHLTSAGAGVEQRSGTGVGGLAPDSVLHMLSDELLGTHKMDDLHEKVKYPAISSSLSELYEGHFEFVRGLAPGLATHVLSDKSLQTLHQMDDLHEEMKLSLISLRLSE